MNKAFLVGKQKIEARDIDVPDSYCTAVWHDRIDLCSVSGLLRQPKPEFFNPLDRTH